MKDSWTSGLRSRGALACAAPVAILLFGAGLKAFTGESYRWLTHEDGPVEYVQAACYVFAALVGALVARACSNALHVPESGVTRAHRALWVVFAIGCLFVALEEISWGERLTGLGFETVRDANLQRETTVHNLPLLQPLFGRVEMVMGLIGGTAWMFASRPSFIAPDRLLLLYFVVPAAAYLFNGFSDEVSSSPFLLHQEIFELLMALGLLLHALIVRQQIARVAPVDRKHHGTRRGATRAATAGEESG